MYNENHWYEIWKANTLQKNAKLCAKNNICLIYIWKIRTYIIHIGILFVSLSPDLYSIALGKFDKYKIELKNMKADSAKYEFTLDNQFFVDLDGPEVQKGKLAVELNVKKTSGVFLLDFQTEGFVIVPCDRCLDEMSYPKEISAKGPRK